MSVLQVLFPNRMTRERSMSARHERHIIEYFGCGVPPGLQPHRSVRITREWQTPKRLCAPLVSSRRRYRRIWQRRCLSNREITLHTVCIVPAVDWLEVSGRRCSGQEEGRDGAFMLPLSRCVECRKARRESLQWRRATGPGVCFRLANDLTSPRTNGHEPP